MIIEENGKYSDIIQWRFHDIYKNVTIKTLAILNWASKYCTISPYILKADDDAYVNVVELHTNGLFGQSIIKEISKYQNIKEKCVIYGLFVEDNASRDKSSMYFIPRNVYPNNRWPTFARGQGYMMTQATTSILFNCAVKCIPLLILDDVAITGISRSKCNIHISIKNQSECFYHVDYHNTEWNYVDGKTERKLRKNRIQKMIGRSIIYSNHLTESIFRRIHHYVMNSFDFNLDSLRSLGNQYRNI